MFKKFFLFQNRNIFKDELFLGIENVGEHEKLTLHFVVIFAQRKVAVCFRKIGLIVLRENCMKTRYS